MFAECIESEGYKKNKDWEVYHAFEVSMSSLCTNFVFHSTQLSLHLT